MTDLPEMEITIDVHRSGDIAAHTVKAIVSDNGQITYKTPRESAVPILKVLFGVIADNCLPELLDAKRQPLRDDDLRRDWQGRRIRQAAWLKDHAEEVRGRPAREVALRMLAEGLYASPILACEKSVRTVAEKLGIHLE